MKIVQINSGYGKNSGIERIVRDLHEALRKSGHEGYVFCADCKDKRGNVYRIGNRAGQRMHGFLSGLTGLQGYFSHFSTASLIRKLKRIRPDVIHLHDLHENYINLPMFMRYLGKSKTPVVVSLHDSWLMTGHCCNYMEFDCDKWMFRCSACPAIKNRKKRVLFDPTRKCFDDKNEWFLELSNIDVVCSTNWGTEEAEESFLSDYACFHRIHHWADLNVFNIPKKHHNDRPVILLKVSDISENDDLDDIIRIAKDRKNYEFRIIGNLPKNQHMPANVICTGEIDHISALVREYQTADVFLHLDSWGTFEKTLAEVLACGTRCIAYDYPAMKEIIPKGCGKVVPIGHWQSAAAAIDELLKEPWTNTCRSFAVAHFDKKARINDYLNIYKKAASL